METQTPLGQPSTETEIQTPLDESDIETETQTPLDESDIETETQTPLDESDIETETQTPLDESDTEMETQTPLGEPSTDTETQTPLGEPSTETETQTPLDESDTETPTPLDESDTETETQTPLDESNTEMETQTPLGEPSTETETQTPLNESATEAGNIVEVASGSNSFNTLVQAIQAAGLADTLSDSSASYTVFAPTDEAFSQLPDGTLEYLLQPENQEVLQQVLSYHVLPEKVTSEEISGGSVDSLNGGLATAVTDRGVVINNASVINPDIQASNGVIHGINRVLLPADLQTTLASELGVSEADIYQ